ncbi:hypothetical protein F2P79_011520 [Pimephales promelas]|nr:hypothetical protein F2P79_011520 [Pimephales promelas]
MQATPRTSAPFQVRWKRTRELIRGKVKLSSGIGKSLSKHPEDFQLILDCTWQPLTCTEGTRCHGRLMIIDAETLC